MNDGVVITGMGVISPFGIGSEPLWENLMQGKNAMQHCADLAAAGYRYTHACRVPDFESPATNRGTSMAIAAIQQAIVQSNIQLPGSTGIFLGSTLGESLAFEMAAEGAAINLREYNTYGIARAVADYFKVQGTVQALSTACAAGNYAIGAAAAALKRGAIDVAVAGGTEPFSRLAMVGFTRTRAMAPDTCKPFDAHRSGMVLGEGAAFFILERLDRAIQRGAKPLARVYALGLCCDAHHPTSPHPDGRGLYKAMLAACKEAGIAAHNVDWVNIHGSGTKISDAAEALALKKIFSGRMPLLSGSKGAIGHALGAASALELAVCVNGIATKTVPPTPGHEETDPEMALACTKTPVQCKVDLVLNNASAFGGLNASLLLGTCVN